MIKCSAKSTKENCSYLSQRENLSDVRDHLYLPLRTKSLDEIDERCGPWHEWNRHIAEALDDISWDECLLYDGLTGYGEVTARLRPVT
jgi:hypothetical protein